MCLSVYQCVFSTINTSWVNIRCYKAACLIQLFVIEIGEEQRKEELNTHWRANKRVTEQDVKEKRPKKTNSETWKQ